MANGPLENLRPAEGAAALEKGQQPKSLPVEEVWDEERLEKAMKTLKEMHIQLRGLRTSIPRLLAPFATRQPSPEALFREFSKSAKTANMELEEFRQLMRAEDSKKVLVHAKESRSGNPNGLRPWRITNHPDWLTRDS